MDARGRPRGICARPQCRALQRGALGERDATLLEEIPEPFLLDCGAGDRVAMLPGSPDLSALPTLAERLPVPRTTSRDGGPSQGSAGGGGGAGRASPGPRKVLAPPGPAERTSSRESRVSGASRGSAASRASRDSAGSRSGGSRSTAAPRQSPTPRIRTEVSMEYQPVHQQMETIESVRRLRRPEEARTAGGERVLCARSTAQETCTATFTATETVNGHTATFTYTATFTATATATVLADARGGGRDVLDRVDVEMVEHPVYHQGSTVCSSQGRTRHSGPGPRATPDSAPAGPGGPRVESPRPAGRPRSRKKSYRGDSTDIGVGDIMQACNAASANRHVSPTATPRPTGSSRLPIAASDSAEVPSPPLSLPTLLSSGRARAATESTPWSWAFDKIVRGGMCSVSTSPSCEDTEEVMVMERLVGPLQPRAGSRGSSTSPSCEDTEKVMERLVAPLQPRAGSRGSSASPRCENTQKVMERLTAPLQPRAGSRGSSISSGSCPSRRSGEESDRVRHARSRHYSGKGTDLKLDDIIETCNAVSHSRHLSPRPL